MCNLKTIFIIASICFVGQCIVLIVLGQDYALKVKNSVKVLDVAKLKFEAYLKDFNKTYHGREFDRRFENFKASLKNIAISNALEGNIVFGLTKFSDMSKQEFMNRMLLNSRDIPKCVPMSMDCELNLTIIRKTIYKRELKSSFDWRKRGVVKPVLNQKLCLGCWAFGIVGVIESMSAIRMRDYASRSIQELLDCSTYTNGCHRGSVSRALRFMCINKTPIVTEQEYPMTLGLEQDCKLPKNYTGRMVRRYMYQCNVTDTKMVKQIAFYGPVVATVDATNWANYIGGVIQRACTRGNPNHVVQVVGYAGYGAPPEARPPPHYIIRNSMGEDFGENGYVRVAMDSDLCGITERVAIIDVM